MGVLYTLGGIIRKVPEKKKISARKYIFVKENY